jgi:nitrogen regulatory protein P-II 1
MSANRKYLTNLHQITCIVERGKADEVVKAAMKAGAPAATISFARGTGIRERLGLLKIAISPEKEVIYVITAEDKTDAVFDAMIDAGELELPGKGFIYVTQVLKAVTYLPSQSV